LPGLSGIARKVTDNISLFQVSDGRISGKFEYIQPIHGNDRSVQYFRGEVFKKNAVVAFLETLCLLRMNTGNPVYVLDV